MNAKYSTYIGCAILAVVLVLSPLIIFLVRNATNTIQVNTFQPPKLIQPDFINIAADIYAFHFTCRILFGRVRFMRAIYRKRRKNWNVKNVKVICCYFKCCHRVWRHNWSKHNVYRPNIMTVWRFISVISLVSRKSPPNAHHLR